MPTATLTEAALALIDRPVLASVATISPNGTPQITPVWIETEGNDLLINTSEDRTKATNLRHDPHVAVSVIDPENPYNVVAVRGTVTELTTEGADEQIDRLAKKYLGLDAYPMRRPGEVRLKVRIHVDRVSMQPVEQE